MSILFLIQLLLRGGPCPSLIGKSLKTPSCIINRGSNRLLHDESMRGELDRVLSEVRLSQVVRQYVPSLRPSKSPHGSFIGLCPFHPDKNPSLHVSDERGTYHCFACGAHGNVIRFLRDKEQLNSKQALARVLALSPHTSSWPDRSPCAPSQLSQIGRSIGHRELRLRGLVPVPTGPGSFSLTRQSSPSAPTSDDLAAQRAVLEAAAQFFIAQLTDTEPGRRAKEYLLVLTFFFVVFIS
jgi:hypothetical protein